MLLKQLKIMQYSFANCIAKCIILQSKFLVLQNNRTQEILFFKICVKKKFLLFKY